MRYLQLLVILAIFVSCSSKKDTTPCILPSPIEVTGIPFQNNIQSQLPFSIDLSKRGFVVMNSFSRNEIVSVYDTLNADLIMSYGQLGKGPNEFISPVRASFSELMQTLDVYDVNANIYTKLRIQDSIFLLFKYNANKLNMAISQMIAISDNLFLVMTYTPQKLLLVDSIGNVKCETLLKPLDIPETFYLQGAIAYNPIHKILCFTASEFGYIASYKIDANGKIDFLWEKFISEPTYKVVNNKIIWDENHNLAGFMGEARFQSDRILVLYQGKKPAETIGRRANSVPNNLLVFNIKGEVWRFYKLNPAIFQFTVSQANNGLFGISMDPEFRINRFYLP
jgi:hypothetical protein